MTDHVSAEGGPRVVSRPLPTRAHVRRADLGGWGILKPVGAIAVLLIVIRSASQGGISDPGIVVTLVLTTLFVLYALVFAYPHDLAKKLRQSGARFEADTEGILWATPGTETRIAWPLVRRISRRRGVLQFRLRAGAALLIPEKDLPPNGLQTIAHLAARHNVPWRGRPATEP